MGHDFAKGKKAAKPKRGAKKQAVKSAPVKSGLPAWFWFFSGVVFTLFLQLFYFLSQQEKDIDPEQHEAPASQSSEPAEVPDDHQPHINFYDELKNREVEVSDEVVKDRASEDYNVMLQAGSFKSQNDAEALQASIILLGLDTTVRKHRAESGTLWHKVIVGPFTSRSDLARAQSILINQGIKSFRVNR